MQATVKKQNDMPEKIGALIAKLEERAAQIVNEEVDGWVIRRASIFEVDDRFGTIYAESRFGSAPLSLPETDLELCLAVLEGEVVLQGYAGTLKANQFFVVRPKDGRTIIAVQHPCQITAFFFRGQDAEPGVAASAAA